MKRTLLVGLVGVAVLGVTMGVTEASIGQSLGNLWGYLTSPVNCIAQAGASLVALGADLVKCVLGNINPAHIIP